MVYLSNYHINQQIYESSQSLIYRGYRIADEQAVILKMLKNSYPSSEKRAWYQKEYDIIQRLNLPGVIKAYALENQHQHLFMVLEDFGGDSLALLKS